MRRQCEKGAQHIKKLTVSVLKSLIRYVFCLEDWKKTDLWKLDWKAIVKRKYELFVKEDRPPFLANTCDDVNGAVEEVEDDSESDDNEDNVDTYVEI